MTLEHLINERNLQMQKKRQLLRFSETEIKRQGETKTKTIQITTEK